METFEPVIVAFCCHYCAYTAADMAGSKRLPYPTNVNIVRVPCSGKVDAIHLMKAFEKGADGVYVAGCLEGGCHFIDGNLFAKKRVIATRDMLEELGLEKDRLRMVNVSASMARPFTEIVHEMADDDAADLIGDLEPEQQARVLAVVDDEAKMTLVVGSLFLAEGELDELVAHVDEGVLLAATAQAQVEQLGRALQIAVVPAVRSCQDTDAHRHHIWNEVFRMSALVFFRLIRYANWLEKREIPL